MLKVLKRCAAVCAAVAMLAGASAVLPDTHGSITAEAADGLYYYDPQGDFYAYYTRPLNMGDRVMTEWQFTGFCASISDEGYPDFGTTDDGTAREDLTEEQKAAISSVTLLSEIDGQPVTGITHNGYFNDYGYYVVSAGFTRCTNLTSITVPGSVTEIDATSFDYCSGLTEILVDGGDHFTSVDGVLFSADEKTLIRYPEGKGNTYSIPDGTERIGWSAFEQCRELTSVIIPDSVTSIGIEAFYYCSGLTSVSLPEGLTSIGSEAFSHCKGLRSVTIPGNVAIVGSASFAYCTDLTSVTINDGVTTIGSGAFTECDALTAVSIPGSVETIRSEAFAGCNLLEEVTLSDGLKTVENRAFSGIPIMSITIPESVTTIGTYAFGYHVSGLKIGYVIYGASGSAAEAYANANNIRFVAVGDAEMLLGDLDNNGTPDSLDAAAILTASALEGAGLDSGLTEAQQKAADVDGSGHFDSVDAAYILQYSAYIGSGLGSESLEEYMQKQ